MCYEENLSAEPPGSQAPPRVSRPHGDHERTQGTCPPQGQGAQAPVGVTGRRRMPERLKKRRDFVAASKGYRAERSGFALEVHKRADAGAARIGFTVSKRTAVKAVERNRIRRRLKELVRVSQAEYADGFDYVLVGRRPALTKAFAELVDGLRRGLVKVHRHTATAARERSPG